MNTISIGDVHGHPSWKKIIPLADMYDKIIFVGDYVDEYDIDNETMIQNLLDIIQFKTDNPEKVELLIGNHDASYIYFPDLYFRCAGFRPELQPDITRIFYENMKLFKMAYQHKNYLWTHAGVSNRWYRNRYIPSLPEMNIFKYLPLDSNLADEFNFINDTSRRVILHQKSSLRNKVPTTEIPGGITWADRGETYDDYLREYHQIVGHTPIARNTTIGDEISSITYIDSLGSPGGGFYELAID